MNGPLKTRRRTTPYPTRCPRCDCPVRSRGQKAADFPGTRAHVMGDGTCSRCWDIHRRKTRISQPLTSGLPQRALDAINYANTLAGLARLLRARHRRGAPPEGWIPNGYEDRVVMGYRRLVDAP